MAIKVHGHPLSPAVQRVVLCLAEKDLEHEFVLVDLTTGAHKNEPFISINPFGQVPGFEDGDLKLFESRAITKYIAHAYADKGTPLIFEDPKKMAIVGVWSEVEAQKFDAAGQKLSFELLIKPIKGWPIDEGLVEQLQSQLAGVLDVYEGRLGKSKYLGGDEFSLADLHHIPIINNLLKTKVKVVFEERPHVNAWVADILARPAWQKPFGQVPAFEDGDLKLFESRAITQYIAHNYADKGTPLLTKDPKKMAITAVWIEVESNAFDAAASKLSYEIVVKPILGMTTDEGVVDQHQGKLSQILDVYESHLSKSKYLGGEAFSLADLHHIPIISNLFGTKIKALFEARPHVKAWCEDILARPAWQKVSASMKF